MDQEEWQALRNNPAGADDYFNGPEAPTKQARAYDRADEDQKLHFAMAWTMQLFDHPGARVPQQIVFGWDVPEIARCARRAYEANVERDGEYMARRFAIAAMWEWNVRKFMKLQSRETVFSGSERPSALRYENE